MNQQRKTRVAVVFGGRGPEHAISCASGGTVLAALDRDRYEVIPIGILPDGRWVLTADEPERLAITDGQLPSVEAVAEPGGQVLPWGAAEPGTLTRPSRAPSPGCWAMWTWCCRCCTARSVRTAPSRACSRWRASATSAPACWPARSAWTRST